MKQNDLGGRIADRITTFMGSWRFITLQSFLMLLWVVFNTLLYLFRWDPYPFVFLNLFMSAEAAYATPIILMSGNRQESHNEAVQLGIAAALETLERLAAAQEQHLEGTAQQHSEQLSLILQLLTQQVDKQATK